MKKIMMRNLLMLVFALNSLFFSGCSTVKNITVPIENTSLSKEKATIIVFQSETNYDFEAKLVYEIIVDKESVGVVSTKAPLKFSVTPGFHEINAKTHLLDRITKQQFSAGETYFFRLWLQHGMWVSSVWLEPTYKIDSYKTIMHEDEKE